MDYRADSAAASVPARRPPGRTAFGGECARPMHGPCDLLNHPTVHYKTWTSEIQCEGAEEPARIALKRRRVAPKRPLLRAGHVGAEAPLDAVHRAVAAIAPGDRRHQRNEQERRVEDSVFHGSIVKSIRYSRQFWP